MASAGTVRRSLAELSCFSDMVSPHLVVGLMAQVWRMLVQKIS
jgi:hypothetical protein